MFRPVTDDDIGLKVLREAPVEASQIIDIVAVHGIGAHPGDSWCKNVGTAEHPQWVNWLEKEDMLPAVAVNARIMRYGYQSQWFGEGAMRHNVSTIARRLLLAVRRKREKHPFRPLMFIAHCFGGLVVLKALVDAQHDEGGWQDLFMSTTGLVFLGTPFRGEGGMSQVEMFETIRRAYQKDEVQPEVLKILEPGNEFLQEVVDQFRKMERQANKTQVACFYELKSSDVGKMVGIENQTRFRVSGSSACIVPSDATNKFSLSRTHFDMNKFGKPTEEDFEVVEDVVKKMIDASHELILARFQNKGKHEINLCLRGVPVINQFVQREAEMRELERYFLEKPTATPRRRVVVVHGPGGIGKTQLAVEFAREYRRRFSSIIWLDGSSEASLKQSFADMIQKLPHDDLTADGVESLKHPVIAVEVAVCECLRWLSLPSNHQWLLIMDNVDRAFYNMDDQQAHEVKNYFPYADQGSILITSRLASLQKYGLGLMVETINAEQSRAILENNAGGAVNDADVVLERLRGVPLALAQAGSCMRETNMSASTYAKHYDLIWDQLMQDQGWLPQEHSGRIVLTTWMLLQRAQELEQVEKARTNVFDDVSAAGNAPTDSGYRSGSGTKPKGDLLSGICTAPSIYSEFSTQDRGYISQMASDLFGSLRPYRSDGRTLKRISETIPELLKAFALKIGYGAGTQMHRDIAYYVRRYRRDIQFSFEDLMPIDDENIDANGVIQGEFTIERFMDEPLMEYLDNETELNPQDTLELDEGEPELVSESEEVLNSGLYRNAVLATPAYKWLIASLQREARLTRTTPDLMERIKEIIFSALPFAPKPNREESSQKYLAVFELDWDPVAFIKEQEYSETPEEVLEKVITLTGSLNDSQAVTTISYLCQTWPVTGEQVMRLVNDSLRRKGDVVDSVFPDGTKLAVQVSEAENSGHKFQVTAAGTAESIVEIGQQFAWLGAGLRSSPSESGIAICSPAIRDIRLGDMPSSSVPHVVEFSCRIEFMIATPENDVTLPGQCWHGMFRNPVMVQGYPILSKKEQGIGIEMPLNIMAGLVDTDRAIEFSSNIFIKGFSAMLVATRTAEDLLIWHHYNSTGDMISFLDKTQPALDNIGLSQLDSFRHVVGWCSQCICYAGADDADYNVQGSELPPTTTSCVLEKASISVGKLLTAGMSFALGVKDNPRYRLPNGYIMTLRNLEKKYVVLWDDDSKRGWLVNGTSALLHLVRAWLSFAAKDKFSSRFLFDPAKLMNGINHHNPDSAIDVLINASNMALPIYPGSNELFEEEETKWKMGEGSTHSAEQNWEQNTEAEESLTLKRKKGYILFENLVQHHISIMHQIFEHQRDKAGENGIKIKRHVRTYLEGWDFLDLATDCEPRPRVATLNAMGYGWVDFIRSIGAITLLGCGFGDIIQPIVYSGMCPEWTSLPPDHYYLAVSAVDLKNITRVFGTTRTNPPQPIHGLVWHSPGDMVGACNGPCRGRGRGLIKRIRAIWKPHSDPVQVLYPKKMHEFLRLGGPEKIHSGGAVVFGHNFSWKYRWRADAAHDIEECDDATCTPEDEDVFMADPLVYGSGSEPSTEANGSSVAGRSSTQGRGSSSLTPSTSNFVDSNATSPRPPPLANDDLVDSTNDSLRQSEQQLSSRKRYLRHEKRRLGE